LPDLPKERFHFIGNSSLTGAKFALLSYPAMMKAWEIARQMTYIELSVELQFMEEYIASLFLPHTNVDVFPTVKEKLNL
jgi:uncharacterized 2Fe-2S/4Fe-4S cluster protein (DUF4445 family)